LFQFLTLVHFSVHLSLVGRCKSGLGSKPVPSPLSVDEPRGVGELEKSRRDLLNSLIRRPSILLTLATQYISGHSSFYSKCTYR